MDAGPQDAVCSPQGGSSSRIRETPSVDVDDAGPEHHSPFRNWLALIPSSESKLEVQRSFENLSANVNSLNTETIMKYARQLRTGILAFVDQWMVHTFRLRSRTTCWEVNQPQQQVVKGLK